MARVSEHYHLTVGSCYHDDRYQVITRLGVGSSSTVWAVRDLRCEPSRPSRLAIKVLDSDYHDTSSELEILRHLTTYNPNHLGYNYVLKLHDSFEIVEDNKKHVCLVVDLVGQSLLRLQRASGGVLPLQKAKPYFKQLGLALQYAHAAGVVHTDIKPDNILISAVTGDVCLCDWGEATWTSKIWTRSTVQPEGLRAPEVLISARQVWNSPIDIWNFGALLYEVVENGHMFRGRNRDGNHDPEMHLQEIVNLLGPLPQSLLDQGDLKIVNSLQLNLSNRVDLAAGLNYNPIDTKRGAALKEFLMKVMVIDPAKRPTATQLIDHVWFESGQS